MRYRGDFSDPPKGTFRFCPTTRLPAYRITKERRRDLRVWFHWPLSNHGDDHDSNIRHELSVTNQRANHRGSE